jgi:hypothetical protein
MRYYEINAKLHAANCPPAEVARRLKCTRSAVSGVVRGTDKSKRIARFISKVTSTPVAVLWPGRYPELEAFPVRRAA